jgi:E3 ubiquitin-protein ligase TRIP12
MFGLYVRRILFPVKLETWPHVSIKSWDFKRYLSNLTIFQAHPLACAASLAVQEVIASENLLENVNKQGQYLAELLGKKLCSPNAIAAPYTFDIRGGGMFWGIEFDFTSPEASKLDFRGQQFAMLVQARCLENGLIIMGFTGGANLEGTQGNHCLLAPAYNVTRKEVDEIVKIFVLSVEEVLRESYCVD